VKVGDLVELSSYSKKLKGAENYYSKRWREGCPGVVTGIDRGIIMVMWAGSDRVSRMTRREIKYFSKAK
jgi:hypothetical protein